MAPHKLVELLVRESLTNKHRAIYAKAVANPAILVMGDA